MVVKAFEKLCTFLHEEQAATAVEYAIMLVLIIAVVIVAVGAVGVATDESFNKFVTTYDTVK